MVKKSIACILILLIFVSSVGCTRIAILKKNDWEDLKEGDSVIIYLADNIAHDVIIDIFNEMEIQGIEQIEGEDTPVVFRLYEIKLIEKKEIDAGETVKSTLVVVGSIVVLYLVYQMILVIGMST